MEGSMGRSLRDDGRSPKRTADKSRRFLVVRGSNRGIEIKFGSAVRFFCARRGSWGFGNQGFLYSLPDPAFG